MKNFPIWGSLPPSRAKVFCNSGDGVCGGAFSISAAHMAYGANGDVGKAVSFIAQQMGG
jgi:cutinase